MKYNPEVHHNRSISLKGYDYSSEGAYFTTIVTKNRDCLLGEIIDGKMNLLEIGLFIKNEWEKTSIIRKNVILDEYVLMPNYFHGILVISKCVLQYAPTKNDNKKTKFSSPSKNIGSIVCGFKSSTTTKINQIRKTPDVPLWQRNYYEHIVRNEKALNNIRKYIIENPLKWELDRENEKCRYNKCKFKNIQEINNFKVELGTNNEK